ncbi:MAG: dTMP kinase [Nitrospinae bacterium]|nr:dTMP kinase [Nitrospinota bacterium]
MCVWSDDRKKGLFVLIEGLDGAGKSTQAQKLVERFREAGYDALYLKEPTNGVWGQKIRQIAANGRDGVTREEELSYFINDREEDSRQNIIPALTAGKIVVMDRYIPSNMAYQGALGFDIKVIAEMNGHFPQPDITFFLDIKPEEGLKRVEDRGGANIGFEKIEFLNEVYRIFNGPGFEMMIRIDAKQAMDTVGDQIWSRVSPLLNQRGL